MNRLETSQKANSLRKYGSYEKAKELYIELWDEERDKFVAAGLLHCFRKIGEFEKALELIEIVGSEYSDFHWWILECTWAIIQGKISTLPDNIDTASLIEVTEEVLALNPDLIALKTVVFKVLKTARKNGDWNVILDWIDKLNPDDLENQSDVKKDWSDQEIWFYYKVTALVKTGNFQAAIDLATTAEAMFPSKRKFLIREKAKAEIGQNNIVKGAEIYSELVKTRNADWWLLHEYGKVLLRNEKSEEAFALFCKAALVNQGRITHKIKLYEDIGNYFVKINEPTNALLHFYLIYQVRKIEGWIIPDHIIHSIKSLEKDDSPRSEPPEIEELLEKCKSIWKESLPAKDLPKEKIKTKKLRGKVMLGPTERPFCFIRTRKNESYFCYKKELPNDLMNNQLVEFDIKKSFDKKKQVDSWKAVNIRIIGG